MNKERVAGSLPGIPMLLVLLVALIALIVGIGAYIVMILIPAGDAVGLIELLGLLLFSAAIALVIVGFAGLTPVNPNEARAR